MARKTFIHSARLRRDLEPGWRYAEFEGASYDRGLCCDEISVVETPTRTTVDKSAVK